nr:hypothetical protein [Dechloromonas sp. CZR5]
MHLSFVDDQPNEEVREERQRQTEGADYQDDPNQGLNKYVTEIQRADKFVAFHAFPFLSLRVVRRKAE